MIQLSLKRSGSPVIVPLNLPASSGAIAEASSQLDQASGAGKTEIVEIKSVIANLPSYLSGLDPDSRTQLAQLNRLSSIIAQMDSREQNIYAGALDGSSINNLNDVIRVAEQVSDYILIPNVNSDVTLGRYVAVAGQMNGDPRFPEAAWPYLDFAKSVQNTTPSMAVPTLMPVMCSAGRTWSMSERKRRRFSLNSPPPKRKRVPIFRQLRRNWSK